VRRVGRDTKVQALARTTLFAGLPKKHLVELARQTDDMDVEAGRVLCKEGQSGREFFVILEGQADVTKKGRRVGSLGPGDFFGEIALIESIPRTATVTAKGPLRFFVLTRQSFSRLLDTEPTVERQVLRALARRVLADER
jgi:CRP/FNR family transcriptional regulator, cyclic AMP receptor protein